VADVGGPLIHGTAALPVAAETGRHTMTPVLACEWRLMLIDKKRGESLELGGFQVAFFVLW
jgi:hypothetical protein